MIFIDEADISIRRRFTHTVIISQTGGGYQQGLFQVLVCAYWVKISKFAINLNHSKDLYLFFSHELNV
ncbi:hypothetical protein ACSFC1_03890 [Pseudothermotoga sp. U03pept]|uniref:hypothetical protein n=1 Tax=Pseudothermotoga sp. U03pept TaxID=3447012 RepID=UPI0030A43EFC